MTTQEALTYGLSTPRQGGLGQTPTNMEAEKLFKVLFTDEVLVLEVHKRKRLVGKGTLHGTACLNTIKNSVSNKHNNLNIHNDMM